MHSRPTSARTGPRTPTPPGGSSRALLLAVLVPVAGLAGLAMAAGTPATAALAAMIVGTAIVAALPTAARRGLLAAHRTALRR